MEASLVTTGGTPSGPVHTMEQGSADAMSAQPAYVVAWPNVCFRPKADIKLQRFVSRTITSTQLSLATRSPISCGATTANA